MKLIQRANKQLRIPDERLDEYKKQGYKEVTPAASVTKFTCPECGKEYASEAALNKHIKEKHSAPANPPANSPNPENGGGDA